MNFWNGIFYNRFWQKVLILTLAANLKVSSVSNSASFYCKQKTLFAEESFFPRQIGDGLKKIFTKIVFEQGSCRLSIKKVDCTMCTVWSHILSCQIFTIFCQYSDVVKRGCLIAERAWLSHEIEKRLRVVQMPDGQNPTNKKKHAFGPFPRNVTILGIWKPALVFELQNLERWAFDKK